ncbi:MAG: hypothetical protein D6677_02875 [Calditrichaeota bacterium]|nr:MAG: hypothetical protein D6677_02875 [Calditrichota bacterium]
MHPHRRAYVFHHLAHHVNMEDFVPYWHTSPPAGSNAPAIVMPISAHPLKTDFIVDGCPVLFPLSDRRRFYHFNAGGHLIFEHDLLQSAFYLLSGQQETEHSGRDSIGRFPYEASLQKQLNTIRDPLVNRYFAIIIEALELFAHRHGRAFRRRSFWPPNASHGLLISHDVDRVDKWHAAEYKKRLKAFAHSPFSFQNQRALWQMVFRKGDANPYWCFDWMKQQESERGLNSLWFFLPRGVTHIDAYYDIGEPRIRQLARTLVEQGDAIGVHGSYRSWDNPDVLQRDIQTVQSLDDTPITAIRQHWLRLRYPDTLHIMESSGLQYDSTLGFAEQTGWRNSYCHPFHPYDHAAERMLDIWEWPLTMMDVTLFDYMGLGYDQALETARELIRTCRHYNGLFVLLWHNNHLDETERPGIRRFYSALLDTLVSGAPHILLPTNFGAPHA